MREYVIASIKNPPNQQFFKRHNWPLHLTLLGNFYSNIDLNLLKRLFSDSSRELRNIKVKCKSKQMFGPSKDIPVMELVKTEELNNIHHGLYEALKTEITLERPYINLKYYRPHVTDQADDKMHINDVFNLDSISLVELKDETAVILATIKLKV
jgi:hypothetical protein